jgi:hypothetical protein
MKIYLVVEDYGRGPGYDLGRIHKAFKSEQKAKEFAEKKLSECKRMGYETPYEIIYVSGIDLDEEE